MPAGETRNLTAATAHAGALEYGITRRDGALRVSLSGILDRVSLDDLMRRVSLALPARGVAVVLDGAELTHLDYRCVAPLMRWNRGLRSFGHRLRLEGWSGYLQAILAMEDWDRELGWQPVRMP